MILQQILFIFVDGNLFRNKGFEGLPDKFSILKNDMPVFLLFLFFFYLEQYNFDWNQFLKEF